MASIQKRKGKFNVVYYYNDSDGNRKQRWESFTSFREAAERKLEIESKQKKKEFVPPSNITMKEFMDQFVEMYGTSKWGAATFRANEGLIRNYINPLLGNIKVQEVTKMTINSYYKKLSNTKCVEYRGRKAGEFVTPSIIGKIDKLLSTAFKQAKNWELIEKVPTEGAIRPKAKSQKRGFWELEQIKTAMENCADNRLYLAMHLSFAASLRVGEALGLTWDCIHISDEEIEAGTCWINIEKELVRINKEAAERVETNGILKVFPSTKINATTCLVLKTPKTESSVRRVFIPSALAEILKDWRERQLQYKTLLGNAFMDFDLVITHNDGRPCDTQVIEKSFKNLVLKLELPMVVFHSLRHSSATYKLEMTNGDIKNVQGDTGHASAKVLTDIYSHIRDKKRAENAQIFNEVFYNQPDLRKQEKTESVQDEKNQITAEDILTAVKDSKELREQLKKLLMG